MLRHGVYPAAITPFDEKGRIDLPSLSRLLAYFEAAGCQGAVLAGTTGEGPSLSAVEKRDLIRGAAPLKGSLDLVLGIATPSLDEARWLCKQAALAEAAAVLLMPPYYYRKASDTAVGDWFLGILDASPIPVIVYNFPAMTGIVLTCEILNRLARHPNLAGIKDSSGEVSNLRPYRRALGDGKLLFVGDETILMGALEEGWSGTISGASNVVPQWLSRIVAEWFGEGPEFTLGPGKWRESAETKFELLHPVLESIRHHPQPATHKGVLARLGVQDSSAVRLPLEPAPTSAVDDILGLLKTRLGIEPGKLALKRR